MGCSTFSKLKPTSPTPVSHQGVEIKDSQLVISTRDVRLIVDGNEIGIGVAKCVGRACNRACWTVYTLVGKNRRYLRWRYSPETIISLACTSWACISRA